MKKCEVTKNRNSAIELLRIISMVMIIFHHFAYHSSFNYENSGISISRLWYNFIIMGGQIGVNIFVLISGYFMINDDEISVKKIIKLYGEIIFYSLMIMGISKIVLGYDIGVKKIVKSCFPIIFSRWYFASAWFVMFLVHPYINKFLKSLNKKQYIQLLALCIVMWSIIPTFTTSEFESNTLIWFILLYFISAYIRIFGLNFNKKVLIRWTIIMILINYSTSLLLSVLGIKFSFFNHYIIYFYGREKITTFLCSIMIFLVSVNCKIKNNSIINYVAGSTFAVYLIHDSDEIRRLLWNVLFDGARFQNNTILIPFSIIVVVFVFIICTVIDLIRRETIERIWIKVFEKIMEKRKNKNYYNIIAKRLRKIL